MFKRDKGRGRKSVFPSLRELAAVRALAVPPHVPDASTQLASIPVGCPILRPFITNLLPATTSPLDTIE